MATVPATAKQPQDRRARPKKISGQTEDGVFWVELDGERIEFAAPTLEVATPRIFEQYGDSPTHLQKYLFSKLLPEDADYVRDSWDLYGTLSREFGDHIEKVLGAKLGE